MFLQLITEVLITSDFSLDLSLGLAGKHRLADLQDKIDEVEGRGLKVKEGVSWFKDLRSVFSPH